MNRRGFFGGLLGALCAPLWLPKRPRYRCWKIRRQTFAVRSEQDEALITAVRKVYMGIVEEPLLLYGDPTIPRPENVRATVLGPETAERLLQQVRGNVRQGASVFTDEAGAYHLLCMTHIHKAVDHTETYVNGEAHTNGLENFWSLLKRAIKGTYVAIAPFHLFRYVEEQGFRFNNRLKSDFERFYQALSQVVGKRITYRVLGAVGDAGFMGIQ